MDHAVRSGAWVLYADIGYNTVDQTYEKAVNVGIAEQTMVGMAAGMASEGVSVYTYCIGPHYIRAWEFVRNLIAGTDRDVTLVAAGEGDDYKMLGKPHMISEAELRGLCAAIGLPYYFPLDKESLDYALAQPGPKMLHVRKGAL